MFLPDNIDLGNPENFILSIRLSQKSLSFTIYEPRIGGAFCYRETEFTEKKSMLDSVQRIIFDYNFLTNPFKQVNVVIASSEFDIVPQYLYEKGKKDILYNFTHSGQAKTVLKCFDDNQHNVVIYKLDSETYGFLMRSLYNPQFVHHSLLMQNYINEKKTLGVNASRMYLNFHNEFLDVFCYDASFHLKAAVSFRKENELNLVYHILNIWDKCGFDQNNDILYVLENYASKEKITVVSLRDYIRKIETIAPPSEVEFLGEDSKNVPLDLLTLSII